MKLATKEALDKTGNNNTAAYYEAMLQFALQDDELDLQHIATAVTMDRQPLHMYGYMSDVQLETFSDHAPFIEQEA
jgi:hypothetical protein